MLNHYQSTWKIEETNLEFVNGKPVLDLIHSKKGSCCSTAIGELNKDDLLELANVIYMYYQEHKEEV